MRIREYCISSLFVHGIGVLLVAALLHLPMSGSRDMTVSLPSLSPPGMAAVTAPVKVQGTQHTKENAVPALPAVTEDEAVVTEDPSFFFSALWTLWCRTREVDNPSAALSLMK